MGWVEIGWVEDGWVSSIMGNGWVELGWVETGWVSIPTGIIELAIFTLTTLPSQSESGIIYVSDATNSTGLTGSQCYSNGTAWIDVTTGAEVAKVPSI